MCMLGVGLLSCRLAVGRLFGHCLPVPLCSIVFLAGIYHGDLSTWCRCKLLNMSNHPSGINGRKLGCWPPHLDNGRITWKTILFSLTLARLSHFVVGGRWMFCGHLKWHHLEYGGINIQYPTHEIRKIESETLQPDPCNIFILKLFYFRSQELSTDSFSCPHRVMFTALHLTLEPPKSCLIHRSVTTTSLHRPHFPLNFVVDANFMP